MIGRLQTNKVKKALPTVSCVQSVDRGDLIAALQKNAATLDKTISVLFEINAGEEAKGGYRDEAAFFADVETALGCSHIKIAGLMTVAPFVNDTNDRERLARRAFRQTFELREKAAARYPEGSWAVLSMGMSGDYKIAIEEGSTMVRIGTAIFGERGASCSATRMENGELKIVNELKMGNK
jgi:pyridoxal phosphate enzyme (YggS family)